MLISRTDSIDLAWRSAGGIEYQGPPEDDDRFYCWDAVTIDDVSPCLRCCLTDHAVLRECTLTCSTARPQEHTRAFKFGPVPTTGDRDSASRDVEFLDGISAIKITYRKITNLKSKVVYPPPAPRRKKGEQPPPSEVYDPLAEQKEDERAVHEQQEKGQFGVSATCVRLSLLVRPRYVHSCSR